MRTHLLGSTRGLLERGLAAALLALAIALPLAGWHLGRAHADVNLTGNWNIVLQTDTGPTTLPAIITQNGTSLTIDTGGFPLTGTINPSTGDFHVTGIFTEDLLGTASPNGNSMSGTWSISIPTPASGPFTGERKHTIALGGVAEALQTPGGSGAAPFVAIGAGAVAFALFVSTFALRRRAR